MSYTTPNRGHERTIVLKISEEIILRFRMASCEHCSEVDFIVFTYDSIRAAVNGVKEMIQKSGIGAIRKAVMEGESGPFAFAFAFKFQCDSCYRNKNKDQGRPIS